MRFPLLADVHAQTPPAMASDASLFALVGYAAADALGVPGTTGGADAGLDGVGWLSSAPAT